MKYIFRKFKVMGDQRHPPPSKAIPANFSYYDNKVLLF